MARKPLLEPAWLVSLLNSWAARSHHESSRALGWYSMCPMLQSGIPGRARSYEPTGFSQQDYTDLHVALQELELVNRMAIGRYFKPWARDSIDAEFHASDDTWLRRLRAGMGQLEVKLRMPVANEDECG